MKRNVHFYSTLKQTEQLKKELFCTIIALKNKPREVKIKDTSVELFIVAEKVVSKPI